MKTILIKATVPDDAEMFSVSYRIPIDPAPPLGWTFEYKRDRQCEVIEPPIEKEVLTKFAEYLDDVSLLVPSWCIDDYINKLK